jgi:hypothetical protein
LAPRHPPNALLILIIHHRPHAGPNRPQGRPPETPRSPRVQRTTVQHRDTHPDGKSARQALNSPIPIHLSNNTDHPGALRPLSGVFRKPAARTSPAALFTLWRRSDSNRRPPACKAGALPLSYAPSREPFNGSSQTSGSPAQPRAIARMGQGGLEPPTPRLSSVCSNQLSYWPKQQPARKHALISRPERQGKDARPAPRPCPRTQVPAPSLFGSDQTNWV